jgi:hypothetical protein
MIFLTITNFESDFLLQNIRKTLFMHSLWDWYQTTWSTTKESIISILTARRTSYFAIKVQSENDIKLGKIQKISNSQPSCMVVSRAVEQEINWDGAIMPSQFRDSSAATEQSHETKDLLVLETCDRRHLQLVH